VQTFVSTPSDIIKAIDKYYKRTGSSLGASSKSEKPDKPEKSAKG
jgi:hypothetical protein